MSLATHLVLKLMNILERVSSFLSDKSNISRLIKEIRGKVGLNVFALESISINFHGNVREKSGKVR